MRIIYVDVDTLRADHTTPYGYHRPTTPNLQKLADKSVVFDRYYCSDSPCLPSRTALTSGRFGITNGVIGHFGPAARMRSRLAEWWHEYAGRPGALPDPMQATLQTGPTYYNDPVRYAAHLRATGRAHLADDLEQRLATLNIPVSWRAPDRPRTAELLERWIHLLQTRDQRTLSGQDGPPASPPHVPAPAREP
ncbi:sulfatase-like hydrolase/transferase [Streptomyces sp. NPDC087845]|uniref:sulfatase-like hydrolase/transferase n=1 Tax=Streptomyces sp. NPDC087845 TaxID=3365806 RepID=UPI003808489D